MVDRVGGSRGARARRLAREKRRYRPSALELRRYRPSALELRRYRTFAIELRRFRPFAALSRMRRDQPNAVVAHTRPTKLCRREVNMRQSGEGGPIVLPKRPLARLPPSTKVCHGEIDPHFDRLIFH